MGEPVVGRRRRPATEPALRRQQRCARRARAPGSGPDRLWRDRDRALVDGAVEAGGAVDTRADRQHSHSKSPTPSASSPPPTAQLQKEFPELCGAVEPQAAEGRGSAEAPRSRRGARFPPDRRQGKLCLRPDARRLRLAHDPERQGRSRREDRGLPPRASTLDTMQQFDLDARVRALYACSSVRSTRSSRTRAICSSCPRAPLTALPFHLLVTEKPAAASQTRTDTAEVPLRDAAWLIKRQAISVLPSVASLQALRSSGARGPRARKPMIGFGDPVFDLDPRRRTSTQRTGRSRGRSEPYSDYWRGAGLDRTMLMHSCRSFPTPPMSSRPLRRQVGAAAGDIYLGRMRP